MRLSDLDKVIEAMEAVWMHLQAQKLAWGDDHPAEIRAESWGAIMAGADDLSRAIARLREMRANAVEGSALEPAALKVQVIRGPEGVALYVDSYRVAGPKPWAGGDVIHAWDVDAELLRRIGAEGQKP